MIKYLLLFFVFLSSTSLKATYPINIIISDYNRLNDFLFKPELFEDESDKPKGLIYKLERSCRQVTLCNARRPLDKFSLTISINNVNPMVMNNISNLSKEKCWLFIFDHPEVKPHLYYGGYTQSFGKIFVLCDDYVDNKVFFKFYYPLTRQTQISNIPSFGEKAFCTLLADDNDWQGTCCHNHDRLNVINFFASQHPGELDLFGRGWDGQPDWKGTHKRSWETLKNYKFNICYEDFGKVKGYITAKIFDSFIAGSVPIYLGAPDITTYVPKECFIDRRDFPSEAELYTFLKNIDEEAYEGYMTAIRSFLNSPQAKLFTVDHLVKLINEK